MFSSVLAIVPRGLQAGLVAGLGMLAVVGALGEGVPTAALELPQATLDGLKSERFAEREKAQKDLEAWARPQRVAAMDALFREFRNAGDAELRERCLAVLRSLVEDDYKLEGKGYMGVKMDSEMQKVKLPGEAQPAYGVRLVMVEREAPAGRAGIEAQDLLLGFGDHRWAAQERPESITDHIKSYKPGTRVMAKIMRGDRLMEIPVVLERRPVLADRPLMFGPAGVVLPGPEEFSAAEKVAKEEFFQRWLRRMGADAPPKVIPPPAK